MDWKDLRDEIEGCSESECELEDQIWQYARKNLAMLNIFIKVRILMRKRFTMIVF